MGDEKTDEVIGLTLWGDPVYRVRRKRGRPPFEWTQENSWKVSMLLAAGWTNDRIAGTVLDPRTGHPISIPTLNRYFRLELSMRGQARDQLTARQLMTAAKAAFEGNVGAMRLLAQLVEKNDMALLDARHRKAADDKKDARPEKLGKKVERVIEAQKVPGDYGDIFDRRRDRRVN